MLKKIFKRIILRISEIVNGVFWYTRDLFQYKRLLKNAGIGTVLRYFPQIFDKSTASHTFDKHYVYMDRWAFKLLSARKPTGHVDVGSSIRFLSMATTAVPVKFVDIRPIQTDFDNFSCITGSILEMPFTDNPVDSLSCLHVAEHIGLGRYGDPLDPLGTQKACRELSRVLAKGGNLYFALPVGKNAVYFNAHRVHSPNTILEYFKDLRLVSFAAVTDQGHFLPEAKPGNFEQANYSCGCFQFTKD